MVKKSVKNSISAITGNAEVPLAAPPEAEPKKAQLSAEITELMAQINDHREQISQLEQQCNAKRLELESQGDDPDAALDTALDTALETAPAADPAPDPALETDLAPDPALETDLAPDPALETDLAPDAAPDPETTDGLGEKKQVIRAPRMVLDQKNMFL